MLPNKGNCVVFIEELGERRSVPYESLNKLPTRRHQPQYVHLYGPTQPSHRRSMPYKRRYYYTRSISNRKYSDDEYYRKTTTYDKIPEEPVDYNRNTIAHKLQPLTSLCNYEVRAAPEIIAMPLLVINTNGSTNDIQTPVSNNNVQKVVNDKNNNNGGNVNDNKIVKDFVPAKNNTTSKKEVNNTRNNAAKQNDTNKSDGKKAPRDCQLVGEIHETSQSDYTSVGQLPVGNPGYVMYPRYDDLVFPTYSYEIPPPYGPIYCNTSPTAMPAPPGAGNYMPAMYSARDNGNMMQSIPIYTQTASSAGPIRTSPPSPPIAGLLPIKRKDLLQSTVPINLYARPSYEMDGTDLPSTFKCFIIVTFILFFL